MSRTLVRRRHCAIAVAVTVFFFSWETRAAPMWVIVDGGKPEDAPELVRVQKEQKETAPKEGVILFEEGGKNRTVAPGRILARIPVLPEGETKIDREAAVRAINLLLEAKGKAPALEKPLQEQVEKWKTLIDQLPNTGDPEALARTEEAFAQAVAQAMPQPHDGTNQYDAGQLQAQIASLEKLKKEFPTRTGEIQQLMDPWEIEALRLREGKKKFEGRWLTPAEWEQERSTREAVAQEAFVKTIQSPEVEPALVGQGTVLATLVTGAAGLFFGISFLFHGILEMMRRRAWWKGAAWMVGGILMVGLIGRAAGLILTTPEAWDAQERGEGKVLEELLWHTVGQKKTFPREVRVRDVDLNSWWARTLHPRALSVLEILVVGVEGWRIQFVEGGLRLERVGKLLGKPLVLRQEMTFRRTEKGEEVYRIEGTLGRMPLPPAVVLKSWSQWVRDVARQAQFFGAPQGIRLEKLERGVATFSAP